MQITIRTLLLALTLAAASCSDAPDTGSGPDRTIRVTVGSDPRIDIQAQTRTAFGEDGTVRWSTDDQIALWAVNSAGEAAFAAHRFPLWHYNAEFNSAKFTADIPAMPEGDYTYYAVSPYPEAVNSLREVLFEIPEAQSVTVADHNSATPPIPYDIMVAAPVQGPALKAGDNSASVNLSFRHKVHVLKITIPANRMGMPITSLEMTFPKPVTGILAVDPTDPDAVPHLKSTASSNVLTLNFDTPVDVGTTVYAAIAPVEMNPSDEITFKAYTETKESRPVKMAGKNFAAGHTTPIKLTIPELYRVTRLVFALDGNGTETIGEKLNSFTLTGPADVDLGNGSNTRTFAVGENDAEYSIAYENDFDDNLSGREFTVTYDSENTLTSKQFVMNLIADERNEIELPTPRLLFENFNSVNGLGHDDTKTGGDANAYALTDIGLTAGWSGQRIGSDTGNAVRISSRHEWVYSFVFWSKKKDYYGRLTAPALSGIKPGVTADVEVTFRIGGSTDGGSASICRFGTTTLAGNLKYTDNFTEVTAITDLPTDNNYVTLPAVPVTQTIKATNATRLSWNATNGNAAREIAEEKTYYIYIDDVSVKIAKK